MIPVPTLVLDFGALIEPRYTPAGFIEAVLTTGGAWNDRCSLGVTLVAAARTGRYAAMSQ